MAFSFIKKVFTFGPDKAEEPKPDSVATSVVETSAAGAVAVDPVTEVPVAEAEAPVAVDALPTVADPVLPEEMDTAGGPADDSAVEPLEDEVSEDLPTALTTDDVGLVPLSLLEAEAAAEAVEDAANAADADTAGVAPPSVLPDISPSRGEIDPEPQSQQAIEVEASGQPQPISPLRGRCPAGQRGVSRPPTPAKPWPHAPILRK
jgi:fused signal recognition particle receptor